MFGGTDQPNYELEDEFAQPESTYVPAEVLDDITPEYPLDPFDTEFSLWSTHQSCFSTTDIEKVASAPSSDVEDRTILKKDAVHVPIQTLKSFPPELESTEQILLRQMVEVVVFQPVTEHKIHFAPRGITDKTIESERKNYERKNAFIPVSIKSIPRGSNIISSHHILQIKKDGEEDRLKLKCRQVLHRNMKYEKDCLRTDSSIAQFIAIRTLLSTAALSHLKLASVDISAAYLQAWELTRDIYMRPPKGWTKYIDKVWKLIKPAYDLVESGRLWQLCIEEWISEYGFKQIAGFPNSSFYRLMSKSRRSSSSKSLTISSWLAKPGRSRSSRRPFRSVSKWAAP